jgi:hypothetical protein
MFMELRNVSLKAGDVVAFAGRGVASNAIKLFTCSRFSHVGGIAYVSNRDMRASARYSGLADEWTSRNLLIESTTLDTHPCVIQQRPFRGVQAHEPHRRIEEYDGEVWLLKLHPDWKLSLEESSLLTRYLLGKVGLEYSMVEAALSGGNIVKRWLSNPESFHYVFCSQLWTGALERVGRYPLANASKVNPGELVRTLVEQGTYLPPIPLK